MLPPLPPSLFLPQALMKKDEKGGFGEDDDDDDDRDDDNTKENQHTPMTKPPTATPRS
jgi:hypothetical protein